MVITKKGPKKCKSAKNVLLKATKCSITIDCIYFLLRKTCMSTDSVTDKFVV
jgi:hypothetical protein